MRLATIQIKYRSATGRYAILCKLAKMEKVGPMNSEFLNIPPNKHNELYSAGPRPIEQCRKLDLIVRNFPWVLQTCVMPEGAKHAPRWVRP